MELTVILQQDNVGGRVVSWGSAFMVGPWLPFADPYAKSTVNFVYDGTNWLYVSGLGVLPGYEYGRAISSSGNTTISATMAPVAALTVTCTPAGPVELEYHFPWIGKDATANYVYAGVMVDGIAIANEIDNTILSLVASGFGFLRGSIKHTPTAGSHTYQAYMATGAGGATVYAEPQPSVPIVQFLSVKADQ
jgi:hypothetical protein